MHVASATFDFSHPSNFRVNHPVSPVTEGLSQKGRGAQNANMPVIHLGFRDHSERVISGVEEVGR